MNDTNSNTHPPPKSVTDIEKHRNRLSQYYPDKAQEEEVLQILRNIAKMAVGLSWGAETIPILFQHIFEKAGADSGKLLEQKMNTEFNLVTTVAPENKEEDHV